MSGEKKPKSKQVDLAETLAGSQETQNQDSASDTNQNGDTDSKSSAVSPKFGRYTIEKTLGEGAMGAVYLAHDSQLNRQVAITPIP